MKKKALFISIEGLEGSGKSSVIAHLQKVLTERGLSVCVLREPGSTDVGEKIRQILLDKQNSKLSAHTELLLYLAARTQLIEEKLGKYLYRFDVIICDRFFDSTLAYQGYALKLGEIAEKAVHMFSLGMAPDVTLLLDITPQEGLKRLKQKDRIESRSLAFHKALRRGYLALARRYPGRIKVIDARASLPEIFTRVEKVLGKTLRA